MEKLPGLREQAARISACTLKFFWEDDQHEGWTRGGIVTSGLRFKDTRRQTKVTYGKIVLCSMRYSRPRSEIILCRC